MATDLYELAVRFKSEGFKSVSKDMDTLDQKGKSIAKAFSLLKASLIVGAVGGFIRKIAVESIEAQKQTAQLNAVLQSTGGIAGVTADEIDKMAGSLQKTTTFSDDTVKSAASLLLTFTNIRGEIFKNTLPAITDMATALGTDLHTATLQVGKALQDPVRGITALRRAGVAFSESQQAVIKSLVETNRLAEAQGIILKELQVEFGGSAAAARNTLGGALEGLKNSWGDLFELTGDETSGLVGAINRLSKELDENGEKWQRWAGKLLDESGGPLGFLNKAIAKMNRLGDLLHNNPITGGGRGGGAGGGRDVPPGPLTFDPAVVMAKKSPPLGGGGDGKEKKIPIPDITITPPWREQDRIDRIGENPFGKPEIVPPQLPTDWLDKVFDDFHTMQDRYRDSVLDMEQSIKKTTDESAERLKEVIISGFSQTLGDAIYNAFAAAFDGKGVSGILEAFGKTVLAGLGNIFAQQGQAMLQAGIILMAAKIGLSNPITSGPALIAAGAALVALGAAFGAIANGGGGRGTAQAGAFRENPGRGTEELTRFKFISRPSGMTDITPRPNLTFNVFGPNDPQAQRAILETLDKANRRAA